MCSYHSDFQRIKLNLLTYIRCNLLQIMKQTLRNQDILKNAGTPYFRYCFLKKLH